MAEYVSVAAIDAVLNGAEVTMPATSVALQDSATGFDGPGSYHIQLATGSLLGGKGYLVTYGLPPSDSPIAMTVMRVVLTPSGDLIFNDVRKLNVGNTGVNATIAQTPFADGSYLETGVVTPRTLSSGFSPTVAHGTSFPSSPVAYQLFWRDDLSTLFIWNGTNWEGPSELAQLNDVAISSPTNGQVLTYDASTSKWVNGAGGGGGGGSGTAIAFSSSATGTNWNPQGGSSVASSYFKSTGAITPPARPYLMRIRALVVPNASSSDTYYGIAVSSDGTHFIAVDNNLVGTGYAEAYYGTVSSAPGGGYYNSFHSGANQGVFIELALCVTTSGIVIASALVNNTPIFGSGMFGQYTSFEVTTVDLTTPFYVYGIGSAAGDIIVAAYSTSLF